MASDNNNFFTELQKLLEKYDAHIIVECNDDAHEQEEYECCVRIGGYKGFNSFMTGNCINKYNALKFKTPI